MTPSTLRSRWERLPLAWRRALVAALALRVAVSLGSFAFGGLLPGLAPVEVEPVADTGFAGWPAQTTAEQGHELLGTSLVRFDALWYLAIAQDGYPAAGPSGDVPGAAAFFPAFPALVGVIARLLGGAYVLAGSLVALGATVAALAGLHRLLEVETGDLDLARRATVALAVFPSAFFLLAPYTESLFLASSVWALVWARRGRWGPAAGAALLAGLTRNVGVLLAPALAVEAWRQHREGTLDLRGAAAAVAAAPLGLVAFVAFGWWRWGAPLAALDVQSGWQRVAAWPWRTLIDAVRFAVQTPGQYATGYHTLDLLVALPVLAAVVWALRRLPATYGVYALAHVLVWLAYPFPSRPLMSTPRFALVVIPVFWAAGRWTARRGVETTWVATSAALLGVHALLFIDWYYVF